MSPFRWNLFGRIAYAPHYRHDMQEYNGWWRHRAFGIFTFHRKATPGWVQLSKSMNHPEAHMEPETEFKVPYPFVMDSGYVIDEEGPAYFPSWKPGIIEQETRDGGSEILYHGVGSMVLTVVDTFKPKGWPTRVFYTRKWIDPQGRAFGKDKLRITTLGYFNQLRRGYRYRQTAKSGGIQEAAESLARSLDMPVTDLLARLGLAG